MKTRSLQNSKKNMHLIELFSLELTSRDGGCTIFGMHCEAALQKGREILKGKRLSTERFAY